MARKKQAAPRASEILMGRQWAIQPERLRAIQALVEAKLATPDALTAWADAPVPDTYTATMRDGIATIRISGPLQRAYDFWCWVFGGSAYELIAKDLKTLRDDPSVRAIVLEIDSPGGDGGGCNELSDLVFSLRQVKPVVAYIAGCGCSAAYWIASAAARIVADPTAVIGSIGAIISFLDTTGWEEKQGLRTIEMVSSQSPRKPMDPTTKEGRADWQVLLDDFAGVFIATVARNRGVDEATVLADYGQGGVFVGQAAVDAGLADALGTADTVHAELLAELDATNAGDPFVAALYSNTTNVTETTMAQKTTAAAPVATTPAASTEPEAKKAKADDGCDDGEKKDEEDMGAATLATMPITRAMLEASAPELVAELRAEGATAERARLTAIDAVASKIPQGGARVAKLAAKAKADAKATAETFALELLNAGVAAGSNALDALDGDEANLEAPSGAAGSHVPEGEAALVQSIVGLHNRLTTGRNGAATQRN